MTKNTSKNQEFKHFNSISKEWWRPEGKFKILHDILPIRMDYILNNIGKRKINNMNILDLGCGGGLICEPLARLKANVTGLDFVEQNIKIAKEHAQSSNLKIKYIHADLDSINLKKKYDLILMLEIIEHLDNWDVLISKIKKNLKPKGILIFSSINQTILSKIFAIFLAENILKWIPKNTHDFNKLVKPNQLKKVLIENKFIIKNTMGLNFNPISKEWKLNDNIFPMNYFCTAQLI